MKHIKPKENSVISLKNNDQIELTDFTTHQGFPNISPLNLTPELKLWKAVVGQAVEDLEITNKDRREQRARLDAISWFSMQKKDYIEVCGYADVCAGNVLSLIQTKKKNYRSRKRFCRLGAQRMGIRQ